MMRRHMAYMHGAAWPTYTNFVNPLPVSPVTLGHGTELYESNCASCHGPKGYGDGEAGNALAPPPANIAATARMGMPDGFFYWTISEGGRRFGTAMPAFKDALKPEDIWSIILYLRAQLPQQAQKVP